MLSLKIVFAASEVNPYMKVGGLADVAGSLPRHLAESGCDVHVIMPRYRTAKWASVQLEPWATITPPLGYGREEALVHRAALEKGLTLYAIENGAYFSRDKAYDCPDDLRRFMFFSKAAYEVARMLQPDIVHAHDWHTGLLPVFCKVYGCPGDPGTVITIHNLAFQGTGNWEDFLYSSLPWETYSPNGVEFHGKFNILKGAVIYSDRVTTVSPTYAKEITGPEFGLGLQGVLESRGKALLGILNGIDYDEWNPMTDATMAVNFDVEHLEDREPNKVELARAFGLEYKPSVPLFGFVGRLFEQKGIDILLQSLTALAQDDIQCVFLGTGSQSFEEALSALASKHPGKIAVKLGFNNDLAHKIYGGTDFFLMPSKFEPCGLGQLIAMRYGSIPIVRAVGGLKDTVTEPETGVVFWTYSPSELSHAIRRAIDLFRNPDALLATRIRCMTSDFSWRRSVGDYLEMYRAIAPRK